MHCLPNKIREFVYKFNNNILGLNTRVSHFNRNVNRGCTFCSLRPDPNPAPNPVPDETFLHLFFDCVTTQSILNIIQNRLFPELAFPSEESKKIFFFCGVNPVTDKIDNYFLVLLAKIALFSIWECKLCKQLPSYMKTANDIYFYIDTIKMTSSNVRADMNLDLTICRTWQDEASRRR
jgi:hypothetical protein